MNTCFKMIKKKILSQIILINIYKKNYLLKHCFNYKKLFLYFLKF